MKTQAVIIESPEPATASVIWLHGLGANGHDFEPIVSHFPSHLTRHTRFIFPHAPQRPITINGGMVLPGWYDVVAMDLTTQQDAEGIHESENILCDYIHQEIERGISTQRIILAGFSQGGAIALYTGLRYPQTLGGIIALSTYLPLADTVIHDIHEANRQIPIFIAHGQQDPVILLTQAQQSYTELKQFNPLIEWHNYSMEHQVCFEEIVDMSHWLTTQLV